MRLFLAALILAVGTIPAGAQWLDRPWPGIPRTADGKPNLIAPAPQGPDGKPDLTGVWNGPTPEPRLDPANARPWVNDLVRQRQQDYFIVDDTGTATDLVQINITGHYRFARQR